VSTEDVLDADIASLNRQFLSLVARHSNKGEILCLRLNVSQEFLDKATSLPMAELEKVALLGTCLVQPLIDGSTLWNAAQLPPESGRGYVRSAARLKPVVGR
jgi:hypothetical protein